MCNFELAAKMKTFILYEIKPLDTDIKKKKMIVSCFRNTDVQSLIVNLS